MGETASDMATLIGLLEKMGLKRHAGDPYNLPAAGYMVGPENQSVTIGEGEGYRAFYAVFEFDAAGNILGHGIWE